MEQQVNYGRFILFIALLSGVFVAHLFLMSWMKPPKADRDKAVPDQQVVAEGKADEKKVQSERAADQGKPAPQVAAEKAEEPVVAPEREEPEQWVAIGSAHPASPYRMLATLTNRGAAVVRIELNSPKLRDLDDRTGYLGHLVMDESRRGRGCKIDVVGPGTPAEQAQPLVLKAGDVIQSIDGVSTDGAAGFHSALAKTRPKRTVEVAFVRDGKEQTTSVTLGRRPLELVRPEGDDPLSFLLTLDQLDNLKLSDEEREIVGQEIKGLNLRKGTWKVVDRETKEDQATFSRLLPKWGLEITKTFRLVQVPEDARNDVNAKAYHLMLDVRLRNVGKQPHKVAYQLDGPTGLPTEGWWYASKVGRTWSAVGLRDVVVSFNGRTPSMIPCPTIASGSLPQPWSDESLTYIGIDAQYFATVLIPKMENSQDVWFAQSQPLLVGPVDPELTKLADTSFRLTSMLHEIEPGKEIQQSFDIFAGPKRPDLLAQYGLDELVYYGWFGWVAVVLAKILHGFYWATWNYGIAIILLTAVVRLCVFPLSKKQALGAQKMQELQPKIKEIHEKYKNNMEARNKAQQELFRKHNYNPLSGCLVMFLQLPIFVALYRLLMVDVELRQAPLLSEAVRWCSNLAAPDMLFDWSSLWIAIGWESVNKGNGFFGMGPYFNLLPILTIVLFLWQQKKLMPPPADEQAAVQMKVMQFMMIFMGFMFFKVASGLCIYFIVSSVWGLAERRFLPKTAPPAPGTPTPANRLPPQPRSQPGSNGPTGKKKKSRDRR